MTIRGFRRGVGRVRIIRSICTLTALAVGTTACTSMHQVRVVARLGTPRAGLPDISPGDEVRITMRNGRTYEFTVQAVDRDAIMASDGTSYMTEDISTLERRGYDGLRTGLLLLAIPLVLLMIYGPDVTHVYVDTYQGGSSTCDAGTASGDVTPTESGVPPPMVGC